MSKPSCIIDFANPDLRATEIEVCDPALVDTSYRGRTWRHFVSAQRNVSAGVWEAPVHLERCECDYDELCHLLEGHVRLTDSHGVSQEFKAGATFVVAAGFKGTWENLTPVRKVFMIIKD
ncbi:cupin domain-containing protein [Pseudomonas azerbaijanoccidentalis]